MAERRFTRRGKQSPAGPAPKPAPEPAIGLRQVSIRRSEATGNWAVDWLVSNTGSSSLRILAVRLPHGQYKAENLRLEPPLDLAPGESGRFELCVRCHEPPGFVTENAFVILSVIWQDRAWRIFARVRVVAEDDGTPRTVTESITTQKVGFSGVES